MSYRVLDVESQKPIARFAEQSDAIAYLESYAAKDPEEAARLAIVRYDKHGVADAAWDLEDVQAAGGRALRRAVRR